MLISIITVNFNNLQGLKRTLPSVINQSWNDFEYLVIDGGSTDGSKAYLESQSQHLDYWVSEPDNGIYQAMNKGIKMAKGDYLLFLNSGDHLHSEAALSYFKPYVLKTKPKDLLYGNIAVISDHEWVKIYPKSLNFDYFVKDTLPHPATLIKTTCFENNLYDETLKIVSDWKFFMMGVCKKNFTYEYIDAVISSFYLDGISSTLPELVKQERHGVLQANFYWHFKYYMFMQKIKRTLKN